MSISFEGLCDLAETCLSTVEGLDPDIEEIGADALEAGEPDIPIAIALGIARDRPELYSRFPDKVLELAKDPSWKAIHPYLGLLEQHREGETPREQRR